MGKLLRITFALMLLIILGLSHGVKAQEDQNEDRDSVYHLVIDGEIEHGISAIIARTISEAENNQAKAVIFEINTPGGRLDSALAIKDSLLDTKLRTIAYIKRQAFSAGALIALANRDIYMVEGGAIGAATPVLGDVDHKAPEKMVSAVRSAFASTAEKYERDPLIAQAMVDESIAIKDITPEGKLLTLTSKEAAKLNFVSGIVSDMNDLLQKSELEGSQIIQVKPTTAELFVRFITSSMVTSLLLTVAMLALLLEFKMPGWGIAGIIAVLCYGLFFWGHHLAGLAGMEDIALVVIGIILIGMEVFIIPGTGAAGAFGTACLLAGFWISMVGDINETPSAILMDAAGVVLLSLLGTIVLFVILYRFLFRGKMQESGLISTIRLAHQDANFSDNVEGHAKAPSLEVGAQGIAHTVLRPSGTAYFEEHPFSVVSEGDFIEKDSPLEVVSIAGGIITVRKLRHDLS